MSRKKAPSLKINMAMNALLTLSSIIFPVITLPYVTRVLGAESVGRVYFASSVVAGIAIFAELGIPVYGIRACARVRDDREVLSRTVRDIMLINIISCIAAYIFLVLITAAVPKLSAERRLIMIMSSTMLLNAIGAEWMYKALEKYTYITIRSIAFKIIALIAMFMLVRSESDWLIYGCISIFASSASNIVNFCGLGRYADLLRAGRPDFRKHIPGMLMLFALAAATTIYTNLDLAILDFLKGHAEAGIYGVSVRIKLVIVSLITSVSAVLLPRNSFYYEKNRIEAFYRLISNAVSIVICVSVPAAVYFILYADECILILAGEAFAGAALPMQIIMPSVIFIGVSNIIGMQMLIPSGRERAVVNAAVTGAGADMILNLILIPSYGAAGAATATLAAEIAVMSYLMYAARTEIGLLFADIKLRPALAAATAAILAGGWVRAVPAGPFIRLAISAVLFFGTYTAVTIYFWRRNDLLH